MDETEIHGKILFVDDEKKILKALSRAFFQTNLEVFTALGGNEGLKIMEKEDIDILIADYKMPEMNGLQLLKIVKDEYPSVYRSILSGFVEESEIYRSMTSGLTLTYFLKPWDDAVLIKRIEHILKIRNRLKNQQLISKINTIKNLPVLPDIYNNLIEAIAQDRPVKDIFKLIEKDISISAKVLQVANSAFYSSHRYINLERVIIYLGIDTIKNIIFTLSLSNQLKWDESQLKHLEQISNHSILVNRHLSRLYETLSGERMSDKYASIGLTHDVGKIILLQYFPERYEEIEKIMNQQPELDFYQAECQLGYTDNTHCEIGAYFLDSWNFAEPAVDTALFHHTPEKTANTYQDIMNIIFFTDQLLNHICHGNNLETFKIPPVRIFDVELKESVISHFYDEIIEDLKQMSINKE